MLCLLLCLMPATHRAAIGDEPDPPPAATPEDKRDLVYYPGDTEHVTPLARKLVANTWLDQKAIWTSPFHMTRRNAVWWTTFGALTAGAILTDRRTTHIFENSAGQVRWGNNISRIGAAYSVLPEVAGFYLIGVAVDDTKARETGVLGGEALVDGLIVMEMLKIPAGRNRPNAPRKPGDFFQGGASFPSGHSIETWALASVIAHEYRNQKWVPWVAYGLSGVVSAARIGARQHYASDVIAGGAIGFFIGQYVVNTHELHAGHHHGTLTPIIQPSSGTYGLNVAISK